MWRFVVVIIYPRLPTNPDNRKSATNAFLPISLSRLVPKKNSAIILKKRCDRSACRNIEVINIHGKLSDAAGKKAK
jgi:hypothetical protein